MNDRPDFRPRDLEPAELDQLERQLRRALTMDAQRIHPHDRLANVLRAAHEEGPAVDSTVRRRWLLPVAAAATVALIAGGAWAATHGDDNRLVPTPPASSGPSATSQPPSTSAPTSTASTPRPVAGLVSLPVYFVGPVAPGLRTDKLFREFLRASVSSTASSAERAKASLVLAVNAQAFSSSDGYLQPWAGQTIGEVTVTSQRITVALGNAGVTKGLDAETERLAVQELVWTAQAAVGRGAIPVQFSIADGSTALFGRFPITRTYTRPGAADLSQDLAPLWVTSPGRGAVLPASRPVVVQGEAIVFEATVGWQLRAGGTVLSSGQTTASVGAPAQGSYSVNLGRLTPGAYTIRVFETSMRDGSVAAEKSVSFSVK